MPPVNPEEPVEAQGDESELLGQADALMAKHRGQGGARGRRHRPPNRT